LVLQEFQWLFPVGKLHVNLDSGSTKGRFPEGGGLVDRHFVGNGVGQRRFALCD